MNVFHFVSGAITTYSRNVFTVKLEIALLLCLSVYGTAYQFASVCLLCVKERHQGQHFPTKRFSNILNCYILSLGYDANM